MFRCDPGSEFWLSGVSVNIVAPHIAFSNGYFLQQWCSSQMSLHRCACNLIQHRDDFTALLDSFTTSLASVLLVPIATQIVVSIAVQFARCVVGTPNPRMKVTKWE